jgi:hypothetical protein
VFRTTTILIAALVAGSCVAKSDQTGTPSASPSRTGSFAVSAHVVSCERTDASVSVGMTFMSNHSTDPLMVSSISPVEPILGVGWSAQIDESGQTVELELPSRPGARILDRIHLSVTLIASEQALTLTASTLDDLMTLSVRTPIGVGHVVLVRVENGSPLVSMRFAPQALGPSVVGAGAGGAILRVGDTQRAARGQGLTPLNDGYMELLTFPRFGSLDGWVSLRLDDWQIIVPSLSVSIPC